MFPFVLAHVNPFEGNLGSISLLWNKAEGDGDDDNDNAIHDEDDEDHLCSSQGRLDHAGWVADKSEHCPVC